MSKQNRLLTYSRLFLCIVALLALAYIIAENAHKSWNIFLAVLGFSAVVFIHECGHFFVAKAGGIKVEVFSIFIPPVFLGIRRTEQGFRVRILPSLFPKEDDPEGDGLLSFTFGPKGKAGETEYRIGTIPIAGYVKMLGQEDTGADTQSSDPRSFGNKRTSIRMAVIVAGVTFNVISAVIILMFLYMTGIPRVPPIVGGVVPGSPAEAAGLQTGDRIIEIAGKSKRLEYLDVVMAAALSDRGEEVRLKVRHRDGTIEDLQIAARQIDGVPVRLFGLFPPQDLSIAKVTDPEKLYSDTGLKPGDRIVSAAGQPLEHFWELDEILRTTIAPSLSLEAERRTEDGRVERVTSTLPLYLNAMKEVDTEDDLDHICSMLPCLRIFSPSDPENSAFREDDIIIAIEDVAYPTYKEMRDLTTSHKDKELILKILRADANGIDREITIKTIPKQADNSERVIIGIAVGYDGRNARVAKTISSGEGIEALEIPRGALITAVDDTEVSSFYDVIDAVRRRENRQVKLRWQLDGDASGTVAFQADNLEKNITVKSFRTLSIPLDSLKEIHKANNLADAFGMSCRKSVSFILQTYVTLKKLISGNVSLKAMSGPVGIATITYQAVEESFVEFLYLLAFISVNLAVVNFLPIPVVDGGVFVLLVVEKIKGSPLSIRVQEALTYTGLALILTVFAYLTYNDVLRLIVGY